MKENLSKAKAKAPRARKATANLQMANNKLLTGKASRLTRTVSLRMVNNRLAKAMDNQAPTARQRRKEQPIVERPKHRQPSIRRWPTASPWTKLSPQQATLQVRQLNKAASVFNLQVRIIRTVLAVLDQDYPLGVAIHLRRAVLLAVGPVTFSAAVVDRTTKLVLVDRCLDQDYPGLGGIQASS